MNVDDASIESSRMSAARARDESPHVRRFHGVAGKAAVEVTLSFGEGPKPPPEGRR
jgi:hypothetical protein